MLKKKQYKKIFSKEIVSKANKEYSPYLLESAIIQIIDGFISLILSPFHCYSSLFYNYNNEVLQNLINEEDQNE